MRNIISDDELLQEGIRPALREYNLAQFTTADVPGHQHQVSGSVLYPRVQGSSYRSRFGNAVYSE